MLHALSLNKIIFKLFLYNFDKIYCNSSDMNSMPCLVYYLFRFEIEKKLRQQKKKEQKKKEKGMVPSAQELKDLKSASQRSMERRKNMEEKKDNKKFSALTDLMKKREEKKKIGQLFFDCYSPFFEGNLH